MLILGTAGNYVAQTFWKSIFLTNWMHLLKMTRFFFQAGQDQGVRGQERPRRRHHPLLGRLRAHFVGLPNRGGEDRSLRGAKVSKVQISENTVTPFLVISPGFGIGSCSKKSIGFSQFSSLNHEKLSRLRPGEAGLSQ